MKKYTKTALFSLAVISKSFASDASISLPVYESQSIVNVSLDKLQPKVGYTVNCNLSNQNNTNENILLSPRLLPNTIYANVRLNNQPIEENTGTLLQGDNQFQVDIMVNKQDTTQYNQFSFSSSTNMALQITQCTATPVTPANQSKSGLPTAYSRSFFFIYNQTGREASIGVGNLFPVTYQIKSGSWTTVFVSTDNQDIYIYK